MPKTAKLIRTLQEQQGCLRGSLPHPTPLNPAPPNHKCAKIVPIRARRASGFAESRIPPFGSLRIDCSVPWALRCEPGPNPQFERRAIGLSAALPPLPTGPVASATRFRGADRGRAAARRARGSEQQPAGRHGAEKGRPVRVGSARVAGY
jgi:hypothetical protein